MAVTVVLPIAKAVPVAVPVAFWLMLMVSWINVTVELAGMLVPEMGLPMATPATLLIPVVRFEPFVVGPVGESAGMFVPLIGLPMVNPGPLGSRLDGHPN